MVVIAVFTIRCPTRLRTDLSRSDSDMRLTNPPRVGYCTTISSDIEVRSWTLIRVNLSLFVRLKWTGSIVGGVGNLRIPLISHSILQEFARDGSGYHPLSSKQRPEKLVRTQEIYSVSVSISTFLQIVKNGETYLPCPSSCDSSCVLPEGDSPDTRNGISQLSEHCTQISL